MEATRNLRWQENYWPTLIEIIELADNYGYKLTLVFNPQWAEYILQDNSNVALVKSWQANGHEVGLQHHGVGHSDWDGYTDGRTYVTENYLSDTRYRGSIQDMMGLIENLASPYPLETAVVAAPDSDYPAGILYDTDGLYENESRSKPAIVEYNNYYMTQVGFGYLGHPQNTLEGFKREYEKSQADEVFGIASHEFNFRENSQMIIDWFEFIKSKGHTIKTVSSILPNYRNYYTIGPGQRHESPLFPDDVP